MVGIVPHQPSSTRVLIVAHLRFRHRFPGREPIPGLLGVEGMVKKTTNLGGPPKKTRPSEKLRGRVRWGSGRVGIKQNHNQCEVSEQMMQSLVHIKEWPFLLRKAL